MTDREQALAAIVSSLDALTNEDPEAAHADADVAILEALRILGAGEVADAWERACSRAGFWYA